MRNLSIISILIALAAGGVLWQKTLVKSTSDIVPKPVEYSVPADDQSDFSNNADNCDGNDQESSECAPDMNSAEQDEMEQQNQQGQAIMMDSYNEKLEKYNKQIGGRP